MEVMYAQLAVLQLSSLWLFVRGGVGIGEKGNTSKI